MLKDCFTRMAPKESEQLFIPCLHCEENFYAKFQISRFKHESNLRPVFFTDCIVGITGSITKIPGFNTTQQLQQRARDLGPSDSELCLDYRLYQIILSRLGTTSSAKEKLVYLKWGLAQAKHGIQNQTFSSQVYVYT